MSEEITTENAQAVTQEARQSNITASDFVQRRLGASDQQETPEEAEAPVVEESTEEVEKPVEESTTEVATSEEESSDVPSQLNLDEIQELSEKLGSRAVARFGELTAKRKAAEERLKVLEAELNKQNPLESTQDVADNPYSDLLSIEDLQGKAQEINKVIEWAEDVLFNADGYGPQDEVTEVEGKGLTKADVRKSLLNARKSRDRFLPAQLKTVQTVEQSKVIKKSFEDQAKQELSWMQGEDNDTRVRYEAMISDPRFKQLETNVDPEVGAQLNYIIAHAANSMYGRQAVKNSPTSPKLNPPSTGASSASQSEKTIGKSVKALKQVSQQFKNTGTKGDFITLRTLQLSKQ